MDAISNGILLKSLERHFGSNLIPTILALFPNRVWTVLKKEFRNIVKQWQNLKTLYKKPFVSHLLFTLLHYLFQLSRYWGWDGKTEVKSSNLSSVIFITMS